MGIEGAAARQWFELLARHLDQNWKFTGRNRRPPRDPVNAMLSLGYTLLHSQIRQQLLTSGFDISLGFLHQPYPAREALTLDFLELFRSGVDVLVLQLIHNRQITPEHFYYRSSEGCRLSKAARPIFYDHWANHRENWPSPVRLNEARPTRPLNEQILGQITVMRQHLQTIMEQENDRHTA